MDRAFIHALTIKEKIEAFKELGIDCIEDFNLVEEKWFHVNRIGSRKVLERILEANGISTGEFAFGLKKYGQEEEKILYRFLQKQKWFRTFQQIMNIEREKQSFISYEREYWVCQFGFYIEQKMKALQLKHIVLETSVLEQLCADMIREVNQITWKCIVIELNQYKEDYGLSGKDREERYLDFVKRYFSDDREGLMKFYRKYPVLARLMTVKCTDLVRECSNMLRRVDESYEEIKKQFGIETNRISKIIYSTGDKHAHGKSVSILQFANDKRVVYKPRNSNSLKKLHEFVEALEVQTGEKCLYKTKTIYQEDYFLEEFIQFEECKNLEEVHGFYYHFGKLIGLAGILHITDLHCENIVVKKNWPVVIDLETILTHTEGMKSDVLEDISFKEDDFFAIQATMLLPRIALNNNIENAGLDLSGILGGHAKEYPKKILQLINPYTDEMRFSEETHIMKKQNNIPFYQGQVQDYRNYLADIYRGYDSIVEFICQNKQVVIELVEKYFKDIEIRHVMRNTNVYSTMLNYMDYPDYLENMVNMERMLSNFYASGNYLKKEIVAEEIQSMLNLDVPIFYHNTSETNVTSGDGIIIKDVFAKTMMDIIVHNIGAVNEKVIQREKEKLRIFLFSEKEMYLEESIQKNKEKLEESYECYDRSVIKEVCMNIAFDVIDASKKSGGQLYWDCIRFEQSLTSILYTDHSLYDGCVGIAFFLYQLQNVMQNKKIDEFMEEMKKDLEQQQFYNRKNVYWGLEGYVYLLTCMKKQELQQKYEEFILEMRYESDVDGKDWVNGSASRIRLLEKIYKEDNSQDWVKSECQQWYVNIKEWIQHNDMISIGLGHGDIGILYGLIIVRKLTGIDTSKEIELLANKLNIKLGEFAGALNNMKEDMASDHIASWCNGIGGLGQGAIACSRYLDSEWFRQVREIAYQVVKQRDDPNMCLCHGLSGDIDMLLNMGADYYGEGEADLVLRRKVNKILGYYQKYQRALLSETDTYRNYSLFTGLTGVGYTLLRVLDKSLPSVLLLD